MATVSKENVKFILNVTGSHGKFNKGVILSDLHYREMCGK